VPFTFAVVVPDSLVWHGENRTIATTRNLFPAAEIRRIPAGSALGRELIDLVDPRTLPLYLFDTTVVRAYNYPEVAAGLVRSGDWLTFRPGIAGGHYYHRREHRPGAVALFVDPLFAGAGHVVAAAARLDSGLTRTDILPSFPPLPDSVAPSPVHKKRLERARRWLVLREAFPDRYAAYLQCALRSEEGEGPARCIERLGIPSRKLARAMRRGGALLERHRSLLEELSVDHPVLLLAGNRELIPVSNPEELSDLMRKSWEGRGENSPVQDSISGRGGVRAP
jgi:hypothetical protein